MLMPWDREDDAAVAGTRYHDRCVAGEEALVDHYVRPLTGRDQRPRLRIVGRAKRIRKGASRIDDAASADFLLATGFEISHQYASDQAVLTVDRALHLHIIE